MTDHDVERVLDGVRVSRWPVVLPVDVAVLVPSRMAQVAMGEYPLRGGRWGLPVIVVGGFLFRLRFAWVGFWWVLRLPYSSDAVYLPHGHRLVPLVLRGRVGVECVLCGWEVEGPRFLT